MNIKRAFLTVGILVLAIECFAADGASQGPLLIAQLPEKSLTKKYELRYKLNRGDVLRYDVTHSASIRSTIDDTTQSAQTRTDSVKVWKVTDVLPSGDIEFMNVVERVHMINQLPDRKATEYDSSRDKEAPPGFEDAAKAVGVPLSSIQITLKGKILQHQKKVRNQGAEDDAPIVLRLPEDAVAIGDTWDEPFDVVVKLQKGGNKTIQTRRHHKLTDVKNGIATIDVVYQVLSPIDAPVEVQIVQRLMNGRVSFDIGKGRIVGQQMDVDKRILGFAGPTSSVQYIMKMEETLINAETKTAGKPKPKSTTETKTVQKNSKSSNSKSVNNRIQQPRQTQQANKSKKPSRPAETANRPKAPTQQQSQTIRR
jgi:hypothetical protein